MLLPFLLSSGDVLKIYVLHWNDAHGHLGYNEAFWLDRDFPPTLANARALAYLVRQYREKAKEEGALVLVMDAADYFQGDPLGELTKGKLYMQVMNYIGVNVGAVGNHDFDFGRDILDSLAKWPHSWGSQPYGCGTSLLFPFELHGHSTGVLSPRKPRSG